MVEPGSRRLPAKTEVDLRPVKKETSLTCSFCVHVQSYREQHLEAMVADACTGADTCWHPATSFGLEMCSSHLLKNLKALLPTSTGQLTLLQDTVFFTNRAELIHMPPKHHISSEGGNRESLICFSLIDRTLWLQSRAKDASYGFLVVNLAVSTPSKTNALSSAFFAGGKALAVKDLDSLKQAESKSLHKASVLNPSAQGQCWWEEEQWALAGRGLQCPPHSQESPVD